PHIAKAFVVLTALMVVPALLGDGTQHRDPGPPDVTVSGNFGRMFRNLPPFAPPTNAVRDALMELGSLGGIRDAKDDLAAGPVALIVDPNLSLINRNNPTHTAGVTFFGQFLDHDMTFDQRSDSDSRLSLSFHKTLALPFLIWTPFTPVDRAVTRSYMIRLIQ